MCTLTWEVGSEGLEVYFNRDEKKDRPVAHPPKEALLNGVRFLSPLDPRGGGTWMLVNEYGVVICLLNRWHEEAAGPVGRSRGRLVKQLADVKEVSEVGGRLGELEEYAPFTLVALSREGEAGWAWDGEDLRKEVLRGFLTSSSFSYPEVKAARERAFEGMVSRGKFHASEGEELSAYSVRMHREDAQTWSRSYLKVDEAVRWEYFEEGLGMRGEARRTVAVLISK